MKQLAVAILLLVFFCLPNYAVASYTSKVDSLLLLVSKESNQKNKSLQYFYIADIYSKTKTDTSIYFSKLSLEYANIIDDDSLKVINMRLLSGIYSAKNEPDSSYKYIKKALEICEQNNMLELQIYTLATFANHYIALSDYIEAYILYNSALKIIINNKNIELLPYIYRRFSNFYSGIGDYSNAKRYIELAIMHSQNLETNERYMHYLLQLGNFCFKENKPDSCLYFYHKALDMGKKANIKSPIYRAYNFLGVYYIKTNDLEKAHFFIDSAIYISKQESASHELSTVITKKAHIFSEQKQYDSTLKYNFQALEIRKELGYEALIATSNISIGGNYTYLGDYKLAQEYINEGLSIALDLNRIDFIAYGYKKLAELYTKKQIYDSAYKYTLLEAKYNDLLRDNRSNKKVVDFKARLEIEQKIIDTESLLITNKKDKAYSFMVISFFLIILIIIVASFNIQKNKRLIEIRKLSNIIETTSQAVVVFNMEGDITYVNNGLLRMTGYDTKNDLLNKTMYKFTNDSGRRLLKNTIIPTLLKDKFWSGEIVSLKKDNSAFICENYCSVIENQGGEPISVVSIFSDITKRKQTEEDIIIGNENLKKAIKTRDRLFSIIAHDLTGPFSSILGFSKIMATEFNDYEAADHIRFSKLIYESSKRTFDLLSNLLHWSRSQLGSVELFIERVSLHDLVAQSVESLNLMMNNKNIVFVNGVEKSQNCNADYNTVSIVIRNLISNAIKFTESGGSIIVSSQIIGNKIGISVTDTGIGIKKEDLENLFNEFSNKTTIGTNDEKGTGLGLLLCKQFVELNKGTISAESELGIGSKFSIFLPYLPNDLA